MRTEALQGYLRDLGDLLKEKALDAKSRSRRASDPSELQYARGRLMALVEVLSLMQQQANAFGIDESMLGLGGFDPEAELLAL